MMNYGPNWLNLQQNMIAQQQQFMIVKNMYPLYLQYCQINGLVPGHPNSINLFCQYYQSQSVQPPHFSPQQNPQPHPQPQLSYNNNNSPYLPNKLQELIPRSDQTLYVNKEQQFLPNKMNIIFKATSGLNVVVVVDKNLPMSYMFKLYMDRLGLPYKHLEGNLQFLHAGQRLNPFDNTPIYLVIKGNSNNQSIVVFDERFIVGAYD